MRFDRAEITLSVVGAEGDLNDVFDRLPDSFDVEVRDIGQFDRRHGTLAGALTDCRYKAIEAAVELGYYETPRTATLDDVADELDCASSTASEHLQKGEAAVMKRIAVR